jgi:hypothetical protein
MLSAPIPVVSRSRSFADSRAMARNPVLVLSRYFAQFGESFRFYLGGIKEAIVTIDPAVIQHVLKTNSENYYPRGGVAHPAPSYPEGLRP